MVGLLGNVVKVDMNHSVSSHSFVSFCLTVVNHGPQRIDPND